MPQISSLSFDVRFEPHNPNRVILTNTTPSLPTGFVGIFKIVQPDGYIRTGDIDNPDVTNSVLTANITIVPDSAGKLQQGQYSIEFIGNAPGYLSTSFIRTFTLSYKPADIVLRNDFDLFTPQLAYTDISNYSVSGFNMSSGPTRSWTATSPTTGAITSTNSSIDIKKNNQYYAENYVIQFSVSASYVSQSYSWLTISDTRSTSVAVTACKPKSIEQLTQAVDALRIESNASCGADWAKFEKANALYTHLINMLRLVLVAGEYQEGFFDVYQQLLFQVQNGVVSCDSIGQVIPPYDFSDYESSIYDGESSYCQLVGDGVNTVYRVNHQLGDNCVVAQVYEVATGKQVFCDLAIVTINSIDITFYEPPTTGQYRVVVVGGALGLRGQGFQPGGLAGQILRKKTDADFDTEWANVSAALPELVPYVGAERNVDLGEFGISAGYVKFDTTPTGTPAVPAVMSWNDQEGTADLKLKGNNVTLQIGQEMVARVVNKTGANLLGAQYRAVRVRKVSEGGAQGQRLAVVLAQGSTELASTDMLGLVTENIDNNQEGFITTFGTVRGINTTGSLQGETWVDGDILFVSPTVPGGLTKVKPSAPNHLIIVGYVEYAHANNGKIFVHVQTSWELDELHNVAISSPTSGQFLRYNGTLWENSTFNAVSSVGLATTTPGVTVTDTPVTGSGVININIATASASTNGLLSASDWATFNAKQAAISLTTTGSSGPATFVNNVLNIPTYSLSSLGGVPSSRTLSINGTVYDLTADRSWSVGSVTSITFSGPLTGGTITGSGTVSLPKATASVDGYLSATDWTYFNNKQNALTFGSITSNTSGLNISSGAFSTVGPSVTLSIETASSTQNGLLSSTDWSTFNAKQGAISLTTTGTGGSSTFIGNTLNIPVYQSQGSYITSLSGEATAAGPGAATITLSNAAVTGKVLTGLTVTGTSISATDSILSALGKLQGQVNSLVGGLKYQGTWNASTNTPTITSSAGTGGHFYIVNVAGSTSVNGISDWKIGDWIVYDGTSWQKVDNTESVVSVNGLVGAVTLTTSEVSEGTNLYFTNARARQAISLTTTGTSGAATYDNITGVLNVPQYSLSSLGGVPSTRTLTINGTAYDLSADRAWSVGTVTSVAALTIGTAGTDISSTVATGTTTPVITLNVPTASAANRGALSAADWTTFNAKVGGSGTINYVPKFTASGTIGNSQIVDSAASGVSIGAKTTIRDDGPFITGGNISGAGNNFAIGTTGGSALMLFTNSTQRIQVAADGTVGINATGSLLPLTVFNPTLNTPVLEVRGGGGSSQTRINLTFGNATSTTLNGDIFASTTDFALRGEEGRNMWFGTKSSGVFGNRLQIHANGRVGINTATDAGYQLDVNGTLRTVNGANFATNGTSHIGMGTVPSAWSWPNGVTQFRFGGHIAVADNSFIQLGTNSYYDGTNYVRVNAGYASRYLQNDGGHFWSTAITSTAGSTVTFNEQMRMTRDGYLGVGTVSPAYRFHAVSGDTTIAAFRNVGAADGQILVGNTAGDLSIRTLSTGDSYIFSDAGKYLDFGSNASFRMRIASGGNVGIGTTNPLTKLHIANAGGAALRIQETSTSGSALLEFIPATQTNPWYVYANESRSLIFQDFSSERMRIFPSGRVFIGSSPVDSGYQLDVSGTGYFSSTLTLGGGSRLSAVSGNGLNLNTGSQDRLHISSGGNVGIGTTSPTGFSDRIVNIYGSTSAELHLTTAGTGTLNSDGFVVSVRDSDGLAQVMQRENAALLLGTNDTERLRISSVGVVTVANLAGSGARIVVADASGNLSATALSSSVTTGSGTTNYVTKWTGETTQGNSQIFDNGTNVGIGTTSPAHKLDVTGAVRASTDLYLGIASSSTGRAYFFNSANTNRGEIYFDNSNNNFRIESTYGGSGTSQPISFWTGFAERLRIFANGRVFIGASPTDAGYQLDVNGDGRFQGTLYTRAGTAVGIQMDNTSAIRNAGTQYFDYGTGGTGDFYIRGGSGYSNFLTLLNGGNVGISTASPSYKLDINGTLRSVNGANFATTSGNVGIGTASPAQKLDVSGIIRANSGTIYAQASGTESSGYQLNAITIGYDATAAIGWITAGGAAARTNLVLQQSGGNVGIGTNNPIAKLDVNGSGIFRDITYIGRDSAANDANAITLRQTAGTDATLGTLYFNTELRPSATGTNRRVDIYAGDNVGYRNINFPYGSIGIGTTSPSNAKLVVSGTSAGTIGAIMSADVSGTTSFLRMIGDVASQNLINWQDGTALRFATSNQNYTTFNERMRIDSAGNVSIGVQSADGTTLRIVPTSTDAIQRTLHVGYNGIMSSGTTGSLITFGNATPSTAQLARIGAFYEGGTYMGSLRFYTNANAEGASPTERMRINQDGNVSIGSQTARFRLNASRSGSSSADIVAQIALEGGVGGYGAALAFSSEGSNTGTHKVGIGNVRTGGWDVSDLLFYANNTIAQGDFTAADERVRLKSNGNFLIGTSTDAGYKLDVSGTFRTTGTVDLATSGGEVRIGMADAGNYVLQVGGPTYLVGAANTALTTSAGLHYIAKGDNTYNAGFNFQGVAASDMFFGRAASSDDLVISTSNIGSPAERIRFKQNGDVGIGTTSPVARLDVLTTSTNGIDLRNAPTTLVDQTSKNSPRLRLISSRYEGGNVDAPFSLQNVRTGSPTNDQRLAITNFGDVEVMSITNIGNVGIGTTSPGSILDVSTGAASGSVQNSMRLTQTGTSANSGQRIQFFNTQQSWEQGAITSLREGSNNNFSLSFSTAVTGTNAERMRITSDGNVGIGVTPTANASYAILDMKGRAANTSAIIKFYEGTGIQTGGLQSDVNFGLLAAAVGSRPFSVFTDGSERLRVFGNGRVFIGSTPTDAGYQLDVNGNTRVTGKIDVTSNTTFGLGVARSGTSESAGQIFNSNGVLYFGAESSAGGAIFTGSSAYAAVVGSGANYALQFATNNTVRASITNDGNLLVGTTTSAGSFALQANGNAYITGNLQVNPSANQTGIFMPNMSWTGSNASSAINISGTLNTTGTPSLIYVDVSDVASNADTNFMQFVNSTTKFRVTKQGDIQTAAPTGGTANKWKLGSVVSTTVTMVTSQYVEVEIGGSLYRLALVTPA